LASAYLIPNIVLVPLVYAAFDPSSHEFPWLVAMYMGLILSDPDLWRLLARISYYDDEDEDMVRTRTPPSAGSARSGSARSQRRP